ncbi:PilZ domain-containing protein [Sphingomonas immobilis]|uniref:PilZ domain-containing protein n=1 Tax=Sphingomonas immobilis TaxID=3063997 RepID=A0ABT9A398_9SPHN|nr:PilZ domain-containing protein [Sphingomonas sp. CA1-15]MDO7844320.1 PilZ domain-containing protein [Sphingomonas sp. CA1-15]
MKQREPRQQVLLPARMRWDGPWVEGQVRNVSTHGLMVAANTLPPRGTYVEVLVGSLSITARAMWTGPDGCGLRSRNAIEFDRLRERRAPRGPATAEFTGPDRRAPRPPVAQQAEDSRRIANIIQYLTALSVAVMVAGTVSWEVYKTMSAPLTTIENAMAAPK